MRHRGYYHFPSDPDNIGSELTEFQGAISAYLTDQKFDWFATFTTKQPINSYDARQIAEQIKNRINAPACASMFWVAEQFKQRFGFHIHALIRDKIRNFYTPELPAVLGFTELKNIGDSYGRNAILPCNNMAASIYISKYITKKIVDYDYYL